MLIGGKLADFLGRRLIFMIGLAVFTGAEPRLRPRAERRLPDRRAHRAGPRRRADEPGDALDHHRDLRAARARQGDRHLGRRLGAGARDRPARRRPADRARQLELDLLHQRADRRRSASSRSRSSSTSRATQSAEQRLDVPGLVDLGGRPLLAHLRVHRGEQLRLDVGADPRRVRRRGGRARHVRAARAPSARADARPVALPQPHVRRRERRDALRRPRDVRDVLLRLALHAERPRTTRPSRRARASCR